MSGSHNVRFAVRCRGDETRNGYQNGNQKCKCKIRKSPNFLLSNVAKVNFQTFEKRPRSIIEESGFLSHNYFESHLLGNWLYVYICIFMYTCIRIHIYIYIYR